MKVKKFAAVAGIITVLGSCSCTYVTPDASTGVCAYKGGPFDSKGFEKAVAPGSGRTSINQSGSGVDFPVNVRQYDASDGLPTVNVTVRGVPMGFNPVINFTLSTVPDENGKPAACDLIEQHLRPLGATDFNADPAGSKWVSQFLNVRMAGVVRDVAPRVLQGQDPTALAQNIDGARDNAAAALGEAISEGMVQQLGGRFFCAPSYKYGQGAEACGVVNVALPEPSLSAEDAALIARPQRAKTEADVAIAEATETARKAQQVADQLTTQAESAEQQADAKERISQQEARVAQVDVATEYEWCRFLTELGQDCALVKAAENSNFPSIFTSDPPTPVVPVTPGG